MADLETVVQRLTDQFTGQFAKLSSMFADLQQQVNRIGVPTTVGPSAEDAATATAPTPGTTTNNTKNTNASNTTYTRGRGNYRGQSQSNYRGRGRGQSSNRGQNYTRDNTRGSERGRGRGFSTRRRDYSEPRNQENQNINNNFWSTNKDYPILVKEFGRLYRIQNSFDNWALTVPPSIQYQLDRLFDNIKPPQPDEELQNKLEDLKQKTTLELKLIVKDHLAKTEDKIYENIGKNDLTDFSEALETAKKQLSKSVPKMDKRSIDKTTADILSCWVEVTPKNSQTHKSITIKPTRNSQTFKETKKQTTSSEVPTQNRFKVLDDFLMDTGEENTRKRPLSVISTSEEDVEPPSPTTTATTKKAHTDNGWFSIAYHGKWNLKGIPTSVNTLVIADSNAKTWVNEKLPPDWGVIVVPGIRLNELNFMLERKEITSSVKRIIVAVGINDRNGPIQEFKNDLRRLKTLTNNFKTTLLEIPNFTDANQQPLADLLELNKAAAEIWEKDYLKLNIQYFMNEKHDSHHYSIETAERLLKSLFKTFLG